MSAPLRPIRPAGEPASRRRLRRLGRQLEAVGVDIPRSRLRRIAAGELPTPSEAVNITFAELAAASRCQQRRTKRVRAQRQCVHGVIVIAATVVALTVLLCLGLLFFTLAAHGFQR